MTELRIEFGPEATVVSIAEGATSALGQRIVEVCGAAKGRTVVLVTDRTVNALYGAGAKDAVTEAGWTVADFVIAPGEQSKKLTTAGSLYQFLAGRGVARDSIVLALGGGVVSDLAGFVAATWMRGVDFVICPTTLEACVDAAIGGKTAVNVPGAKNLVGAFHQPRLVMIDPSVLGTLSPRDVSAGLAESIKHAALFSEDFLAWHEQNASAVLALAGSYVGELIERNITLKGEIVSRDVRERRGNRMLLNFGHTLGHAIEACGGYTLRHGECVSLGMLAVSRLSRSLGLLGESDVARLETLLARYELPTRLLDPIPWGRIREAMARDKKVGAGDLRFVLLEGLARPVIRDGIGESYVRASYESLL